MTMLNKASACEKARWAGVRDNLSHEIDGGFTTAPVQMSRHHLTLKAFWTGFFKENLSILSYSASIHGVRYSQAPRQPCDG